MFDRDGDGFITSEELLHVMKSIGKIFNSFSSKENNKIFLGKCF